MHYWLNKIKEEVKAVGADTSCIDEFIRRVEILIEVEFEPSKWQDGEMVAVGA